MPGKVYKSCKVCGFWYTGAPGTCLSCGRKQTGAEDNDAPGLSEGRGTVELLGSIVVCAILGAVFTASLEGALGGFLLGLLVGGIWRSLTRLTRGRQEGRAPVKPLRGSLSFIGGELSQKLEALSDAEDRFRSVIERASRLGLADEMHGRAQSALSIVEASRERYMEQQRRIWVLRWQNRLSPNVNFLLSGGSETQDRLQRSMHLDDVDAMIRVGKQQLDSWKSENRKSDAAGLLGGQLSQPDQLPPIY